MKFLFRIGIVAFVTTLSIGGLAWYFFTRSESVIEDRVSIEPEEAWRTQDPTSPAGESMNEDKTYPTEGVFTLFSINIHDWTYPAESIATVRRVLDIHERYGIPVDLYFTDALFRLYVAQAPDLISHLRASDLAVVAYHTRPPAPYNSGFDWYGLDVLNHDDLYDLLMAYETHALDLETGGYTEDVGGYAYVRDTMGYAPPSVGTLGEKKIASVLGNVYHDLGATLAVGHRQTYKLGDETAGGLFYRPEDVEVKLYESAHHTQNGGAILEAARAKAPTSGRVFLGIKYHENNFYLTGGTPWWPVYFISQEKEERKNPPFDMELAGTGGRLQSEAMNEEDWTLYESAVAYVSEHPDVYTAVNLFDVINILDQ